MRYWIFRHFAFVLYSFSLAVSAIVLQQASARGLLPMPIAGTDQLSMLNTAVALYHGHLPDQGYLFSPIYTLFLYWLIVLTHGDLWWMRLAQAGLCALVPVVIYRLALTIRLPRPAAIIAGVLWCGYGPATLLGLDFLREIPVCLALITGVWLLVLAFIRRSWWRYGLAGVMLGLCILGRETYFLVAATPVLFLMSGVVRRYWRWQYGWAYLGGLAMVVLPFMLLNWWRFGVFATVPTHTSVVYLLTTFHGSAAAHDFETALFSVVSRIPEQLYLFLGLYEWDNSLSFYAHREMIPLLRWQPVTYNLLVATAAVGWWWQRRNLGVRGVVLIIFAYVISFVCFVLFYRFRIHVVPLLCVLAGAGWWRLATVRNWKKLAVMIAAVLLVLLLTWDNVDQKRRPAERWAVVHAMLVNCQYDEAEAYIRNLDRVGVDAVPAKVELVRELVKKGKRVEAMRLAREYGFTLP